jgi:ElaB/YqjD/DUF883 family membrane-anchored ribosome-binding protein
MQTEGAFYTSNDASDKINSYKNSSRIKEKILKKLLALMTLVIIAYGSISLAGDFFKNASDKATDMARKTEDFLKNTSDKAKGIAQTTAKKAEALLTSSSEKAKDIAGKTSDFIKDATSATVDIPEAQKNKRSIDLKYNYSIPQPTQPDATTKITVWIHGTRSTKSLDNYTTATPPSLGLKLLSSFPDNVRLKGLAQAASAADPANYPFEYSYAFGWSGDLSFDARSAAATDLYKQLKELVATHTNKDGKTPFIRLITHSHGGNVALNLAKVNDQDPTKKLFIDEVILLACPVQHMTEKLIESPLFGKIYTLYSTMDMFQVGDPQKMYVNHAKKGDKGLFSQRRFPDNKKLIQVELALGPTTATAIGPLHTGFITKNLTKRLPAIIRYLDQWEKEQPHSAQEVRKLNVLTLLFPSKKEAQPYILDPLQQEAITEKELAQSEASDQ